MLVIIPFSKTTKVNITIQQLYPSTSIWFDIDLEKYISRVYCWGWTKIFTIINGTHGKVEKTLKVLSNY